MGTSALSIVIATSSRYLLVEKLLGSLEDQTFRDFEMILVCIKSDRRMREISSKFGATLLEDGGKGLEYARNLGIKEAEGRIVVFVDDDVVLERNWLELILKNFDTDPRVGGVGGIPIAARDGKVSSHPVFRDVILDLMTNKAQGLTGWQGKRESCKQRVDLLSGSNMAFRHNVLLQVGGFDENFYGCSAGEDVDMCLRISKEGYYLVLDPEAKAYHYSDDVERWSAHHKNDPAFFYALADNQTYWLAKHQIVKGLKWVPYLLFRFSNAFFWMIKTRNILVFFSYAKGLLRGRIRGSSWVYYSMRKDRFGGS